jgi:hypothetical protein
LIVIIIFADLPAGNNVHILETGPNPYKQKYVKEPWFRAKPAVKSQSEPYSDGNRKDNGDAHTGNHGKAAKKITIVTSHGKSPAKEA